MARVKLTKEEKEAQRARQQQVRQLWQSAGVKDIKGIENLIQEMKKILIEDMYQAELDTHLGYGKHGERPENSGIMELWRDSKKYCYIFCRHRAIKQWQLSQIRKNKRRRIRISCSAR